MAGATDPELAAFCGAISEDMTVPKRKVQQPQAARPCRSAPGVGGPLSCYFPRWGWTVLQENSPDAQIQAPCRVTFHPMKLLSYRSYRDFAQVALSSLEKQEERNFFTLGQLRPWSHHSEQRAASPRDCDDESKQTVPRYPFAGAVRPQAGQGRRTIVRRAHTLSSQVVLDEGGELLCVTYAAYFGHLLVGYPRAGDVPPEAVALAVQGCASVAGQSTVLRDLWAHHGGLHFLAEVDNGGTDAAVEGARRAHLPLTLVGEVEVAQRMMSYAAARECFTNDSRGPLGRPSPGLRLERLTKVNADAFRPVVAPWLVAFLKVRRSRGGRPNSSTPPPVLSVCARPCHARGHSIPYPPPSQEVFHSGGGPKPGSPDEEWDRCTKRMEENSYAVYVLVQTHGAAGAEEDADGCVREDVPCR